MGNPHDVTLLLSALTRGDEAAGEKLIPLVYVELHGWREATCAEIGPTTPCSHCPGARGLPEAGGATVSELAEPGSLFLASRTGNAAYID